MNTWFSFTQFWNAEKKEFFLEGEGVPRTLVNGGVILKSE